MIQLYGNTRSRAIRCIWMLEEMGEPYELIEKHTTELQTPEYLRLNPNARAEALGKNRFFHLASFSQNGSLGFGRPTAEPDFLRVRRFTAVLRPLPKKCSIPVCV